MADKKLFTVRRFLNKKNFHSTAFIFATIIKSITKRRPDKKTGKKRKDEIWYDCELKISDCDRMITLSIDTYNKKSVKNTHHKLDVLINTLKEFQGILQKEMNSYFKNKNK